MALLCIQNTKKIYSLVSKYIYEVLDSDGCYYYRDAGKSLARPTSRCILFDGENISFDASLVTYINSTNIPPIMTVNRIYEHQNLLSLLLVSFLVGLRTYQHPYNSILLWDETPCNLVDK
jgi:hypothetical protein